MASLNSIVKLHLNALDTDEALAALQDLLLMATLRRTREHHYDWGAPKAMPVAGPRPVLFKVPHKLSPPAEGIESPYDSPTVSDPF